MQKKSIKLSSSHSSIQQVNWPVESICAFTTTRHFEQRQSTPSPYGHFNLGLHVGDEEASVLANRQKLLHYLPDKTNIQWLEQVHGSDVCVVTQVSSTPIVADAVVTSASNIALSIMTADCLPILLSDKSGQVIAAIHGGWRPLADNIIAKTIAKMNVESANIVAWLGPCIGASAFEVGGEVKDAFESIASELRVGFEQKENAKFYCDLQLIATKLLAFEGVTDIVKQPDCTYSQPEQYYSYRRDKVTGRMASVICRI